MMEVLGRCNFISKAAYADYKKFRYLIRYCDLRKFPLPFSTHSADAIYISNALEHFSKDDANRLCHEFFRILKTGGVLRIVVPDLEILCRRYLESIALPLNESLHERAIDDLFDQMVRKKSGGSQETEEKLSLAAHLKRLVGLEPTPERLGELHLWMYDRFSLERLLRQAGFQTVKITDYQTSNIPRFKDYYLDHNEDGSEYKKDMLYMEAVR